MTLMLVFSRLKIHKNSKIPWIKNADIIDTCTNVIPKYQ